MWKLFVLLLSSIIGDVTAETVNPRLTLLNNFLNNNKNALKSSRNDTVLTKAVASSLNLTSTSNALQDESSAQLVLSDATATCDSGWKQWSGNGMCYKISTTDTTWYAAEDWCYSQRSGSHLTSIHSQAEAQWIAATYISGGWFPYMDNWVGLRRSCDNTTYVWTDGTPVDYLWWQPGYPGSGDPEKSCVTIWVTSLLKLNPAYTPGQFDDIWDCGTNLATPTCKYDPTSRDCSSTCDQFWVGYKGGCYGIVRGTANFETAKLACEAFGGEMAVITDSDMNEAMRLAFSTNDDSGIANQAWIGASPYSNWAPGKPNKAQGTQYTSYCNVMVLSIVDGGQDFGFSRGVWTDYPCELNQNYVICKHL
ncbi:Protein CBR-CLEC-198 [Caenorhabditis briggsae]|uniref:Protein CBR-CLEC-198 n=1 Tax=Caenorhabditis briggsae TaxID=6238 RepID=A8WMZ6_CAEBR|nr:Protein CBR-CLEC-198 [Caenorhabditis briggsae]CAP21851.2 Protein CBR-CLEC-198 [Caenorhabditis briggsae]